MVASKRYPLALLEVVEGGRLAREIPFQSHAPAFERAKQEMSKAKNQGKTYRISVYRKGKGGIHIRSVVEWNWVGRWRQKEVKLYS